MVFLRSAVIVIFGMLSCNGFSQDYSKLIKAFEESYKLENSQKYDEAINVLIAVYDEKMYEINLRLGWLYYSKAKYNESVDYYTRSINLMPYSIEPRWGILLPLDALKRTDDLIPHYQKILEINPDNSVALYRMGLIQYNKKSYTMAEKYFEKVINLFPFDYDGLIMTAWTKFQLKNFREARIFFNKALIRKPGDKSALEGLKLLK